MIIKYKTVYGDSVESLDKEVNKFIKKGFVPWYNVYGGRVAATDSILSFCQAMVKHTPKLFKK